MQHDDPRPGRKHVLRRRGGLYQARQTGDARARRSWEARRRVAWRDARSDLLTLRDRPQAPASAWLKKSIIPFREFRVPPPLFFFSLSL